MNFYGMRELSNNTKSVMSTVAENGSAIITDNGKPTALVIGVTEDSFEMALAMVQQMRARKAFEELRKQALTDFPNGLTEEEIEAEIQAARKEK